MCTWRNGADSLRWVRPVTQPSARAMRPGIGLTMARRRFGAHRWSIAASISASALVGVGGALISTPERPGPAGFAVFPYRLASAQLLRSFVVWHRWHAVSKNSKIHEGVRCVLARCNGWAHGNSINRLHFPAITVHAHVQAASGASSSLEAPPNLCRFHAVSTASLSSS
jgi:hypothetical protein